MNSIKMSLEKALKSFPKDQIDYVENAKPVDEIYGVLIKSREFKKLAEILTSDVVANAYSGEPIPSALLRAVYAGMSVGVLLGRKMEANSK